MPEINNYITRDLDRHLERWTQQKNRDVLLVRGARQTGKSRSVRELGKRFSNFVEVNFEEEPELKTLFQGSRNPDQICEKLAAFFETPIIAGNTLLFIDEIQECEDALHALRFFKEKKSDLHVIAAGSLLEFTLREIATFGVGRISSRYLYPLHFGEFVQAVHGTELRELVKSSGLSKPIDPANFQKLFEALRVYLAIGGLPEVVSLYRESRDLSACQRKLSDLLLGYQTDFAKYRTRATPEHLRETLTSIAKQAGAKFIYSHVGGTTDLRSAKEALEVLELAGLCARVYHSTCSGIPIGSERNYKKFKVIPFDIGVYQTLNGLKLSDHILSDQLQLVSRGSAAEIFVGTELRSYAPPYTALPLCYWHREARSSNAEVDYVIELNSKIVPIEVKSGGTGSMKSMHRFRKEKGSEYGLRVCHENFAEYEGVRVIPIVALETLRESL